MALRHLHRHVQKMRQDTAALRPAGGIGRFGGIEHLRELRHFPQFARQHLRVVDRETGQLVPLELNWIQRQILAAELRARRQRRSPRFLILKYRRGGVTTLQQALGYWTTWATPNSFVATLAHRAEDTRTIFAMVSRFYDHQPLERRHDKTTAGVHHLDFSGWGSVYKAETAGASGAFRGSRLSRLHISEAAHCTDLRAVHHAVSDAVEGRPYVMESTPNGRTGRGEAFYEFWQTAKRGDSDFTPLFFPWHADPRNALRLLEPDELGELSDQEARLKTRFRLSPEQVKWWRSKRMELVADGRSASVVYQEHPHDDESCFLTGGESYFAGELIDRAYDQCRAPLAPSELTRDYGPLHSSIESGRFRIWQEYQPGTRYVIGVDPAEGVGRDDSALCGVNVETGEQAFAFNRNDIPPDVLGAEVIGDRDYGLGWLWAKPGSSTPAYVIVERENHGHAVLTGLLKLASYPDSSVHHDIDETTQDAKESRRAGWRHNHIQLTTAVGRALREEFPVVRDIETVTSIQNVSNEQGTAKFGGRDLAVAWGLCAIGMPHASWGTPYALLGGVIVNLDNGVTYDPTDLGGF